MADQFARTELLLGPEGMARLKGARVAVFGIGGVGGYTVEALARSGVGALDLIDDDAVSLSNLNRQIIATHATLGMDKVEAAKARVLEINPECVVRCYKTFYLPETADRFDFTLYDYVVDAIDTVTAKLLLAQRAKEAGTPIISAMGAGNKMDAGALEVADLAKTTMCPLARVMRKELGKRGIKHMKVVYSREPAITPLSAQEECGPHVKRQTPGSNAFVPAVAGLLLAGEVVRDLSGFRAGEAR